MPENLLAAVVNSNLLETVEMFNSHKREEEFTDRFYLIAIITLIGSV